MSSIDYVLNRLKRLMLDKYIAKDVSLFLCGGASKEQEEFRFSLGKNLESRTQKYRYSVYYPETIFHEILLGHNSTDLLTLENFLALSVNVVVIPLQSFGTFTELGAFSNHRELRNKLIVVVDPRYRYSNSFVNSGPLRLLRKDTSSKIVYGHMSLGNLDSITKNIADAARQISNDHPLTPVLSNPLLSQLFYISLIYLFDPISTDFFSRIVERFVSENDLFRVETIKSSIMSIGCVRLVDNSRMTLFEDGFLKYLKYKGFNESKQKSLIQELSTLRIQVVNMYYRKEGIYWGGRAYTP